MSLGLPRAVFVRCRRSRTDRPARRVAVPNADGFTKIGDDGAGGRVGDGFGDRTSRRAQASEAPAGSTRLYLGFQRTVFTV